MKIASLKDVDVRLPEGEYTVKIVGVEPHEGPKVNGLMWEFEVIEGRYAGKKAPKTFTATEGDALWNINNLLTAIDFDIPDEEFDLEDHLDDVIDQELTISIEGETYEDRDGNERRSVKVTGFAPAGKNERTKRERDEEEEEEKPRRSRRGRAAAKPEPEDEEEEEEKPAPRSRGSKKSKKLSEADIEEMDQDALEDFITEHDLDVDLSKIRSLSKMQAAVIKAAGDLLD